METASMGTKRKANKKAMPSVKECRNDHKILSKAVLNTGQ